MRTLWLLLSLAACGQQDPAAATDEAYTVRPPSCTYTACTSNAQCAAHEICSNGACRIDPFSRWCTKDSSGYFYSNAAGGDRSFCNEYGCDPSTGLCRRSCATSPDCASPASCANGVCTNIYNGITIGDQPLAPATPLVESDAFGTCARTCASVSDCGANEMCYNGRCQVYENVRCYDSGSVYYYGWILSCGSYACDPVAQGCFGSCEGTFECASNLNCGSNATCS